jgi:capsular polysaccharide transport system permease protein
MIELLKRHRLWQVAAVLMIAFTVYWGLVAAERYVSESHVVVESLQAPDPASFPLSALLTGGSASKDGLLLRDYLLSADMLRKLEEEHDLRTHWHDSYDIFSRLIAQDASAEWFLRHYRSRVAVDFDEYTGLLFIKVQAYTPEKAQAVARSLVREGEKFMNERAHKLAREQVAFVEKEVDVARGRVARARQVALAHQNASGLVSPSATVGSVSATVARLQDEMASAEARRRTLEAYLAPNAPELVQTNAQVRALEKQLAVERGRLAAPNGKALNRVAEEQDRLLFEAGFEQDMYKTALAALERARVEASRTLKKVSIVQAPTLADSAQEPRRLYNIVVYLLGTLLLAGILHLIVVIIREHRD